MFRHFQKRIRSKFLRDGFIFENIGELAQKDLIELTCSLGAPLRIRHTEFVQNQYIQVVSEDGLFGRNQLAWHNDLSFMPGGYDGTLLYFVSSTEDVPTIFCNTAHMFNSLIENEKKSYSEVTGYYSVPEKYRKHISQNNVIEHFEFARPIVCKHPVTNEKSLYFSPETLSRTDPPVDINKLIEMGENSSFEVRYKPHDLVIFDNLKFMHRRPSFVGSRCLLRISFKYT